MEELKELKSEATSKEVEDSMIEVEAVESEIGSKQETEPVEKVSRIRKPNREIMIAVIAAVIVIIAGGILFVNGRSGSAVGTWKSVAWQQGDGEATTLKGSSIQINSDGTLVWIIGSDSHSGTWEKEDVQTSGSIKEHLSVDLDDANFDVDLYLMKDEDGKEVLGLNTVAFTVLFEREK